MLPVIMGLLLYASLLQDSILQKLKVWAIEKTYYSISFALAGHRAQCMHYAQGCVVDAKSLCAGAFPGVNCTWKGGVDAAHVLRFKDVVSKGHFVLRIAEYQMKIVVSHFGVADLQYVDYMI
jgi:hypothetical protein